MTVWKTDQRECPGAVSDTLPARKFPMCMREGGEVLYGAHFQNARYWASFITVPPHSEGFPQRRSLKGLRARQGEGRTRSLLVLDVHALGRKTTTSGESTFSCMAICIQC